MEEDLMSRRFELLVIGGSAGSVAVIQQILLAMVDFQPTCLPIVLVVHRKGSGSAGLIGRGDQIRITEAEEKDKILPGHVYLAPGDYHLLIEQDRTFSLDDSEKRNFSRPSIDVTFESAAAVYGKALVCMLLSGASTDGVEGLKRVKQSGGLVMVQDPAFAEAPLMPQEAVRQSLTDIIMKPSDIPALVKFLCS